jgi:hypothetical protein
LCLRWLTRARAAGTTTKGAKTGEARTSPLVYSRDGRNYVVNPEVTVELGSEKFRARARVADDTERRHLYDKHAEWMPAFLDYEKKTTRKIPVVVLERI